MEFIVWKCFVGAVPQGTATRLTTAAVISVKFLMKFKKNNFIGMVVNFSCIVYA